MNRLLRSFPLLIFTLLFVSLTSAFGQGPIPGPNPPRPPTNNAFVSALHLTGPLVTLTNQTLALATAEDGEPSHGGTVPWRTVWYRWTAPHYGEAELHLTCFVKLGIGIYQGTSISNLVPVGPTYTTTNRIRWMANPGEEFVFAVNQPSDPFQFTSAIFKLRLTLGAVVLVEPFQRVGKVGVPMTLQCAARDTNFSLTRLDVSAGSTPIGSITSFTSNLVWIPQAAGPVELTAVAQTSAGSVRHMIPQSFIISPANDFFEEASALPPILTNHTARFSIYGASFEPAEPNYGGSNLPFTGSLWWKWQPQHTTITEYAATDIHLFIFEGESLENLTPLNPLQIVPIIIHAWDGNGSFSSIPPLPSNARFTNYAGRTYWFCAVTSFNPDPSAIYRGTNSGSWIAAQRLHWLSAANGRSEAYARNPFVVNVAGIDGLFAPSNINIRAMKYVFDGSYWRPTLTGEVTVTNSTDAWSWIPESAGEYDLRASGQYPSGETWQHAIRVSVREANDTYSLAPLIGGITNIAFSTAQATVDADEPGFGTNALARTVWWRWSTETNARVRFSVSGSFGGLPVEIFTESNGTLTRIAHNESRTMMPPLKGFVLLDAVAGVEYVIRVSDVGTAGRGIFGTPIHAPRDHVLSIENLEDPVQGLVLLSTVLGTPNQDGQIDWQTYARVLLADGTPATNFNYRAQFYAGETLDRLRPLSPAVYILQQPGTGEPGGVSAGLTNTPVPAGQNFWIQLRAWDSSFGPSYETARANGGTIGRSPLLEVIAGSEFVGPTALTNLADVRLATVVNNFAPGELLFDERTASGTLTFELRAPRGFLYSVDARTTETAWSSILLLTNITGSVKFSDPRENPPSSTIFRTRLLD